MKYENEFEVPIEMGKSFHRAGAANEKLLSGQKVYKTETRWYEKNQLVLWDGRQELNSQMSQRMALGSVSSLKQKGKLSEHTFTLADHILKVLQINYSRKMCQIWMHTGISDQMVYHLFSLIL